MILYRPVGLRELLLIFQTEMRRFPPRLPEQPIFYPVLERSYAEQIARDWNTKVDDQAGYVLEMEVEDAFVARYPIQQVGGRVHRELWIPAEELEAFNDHLVRPIRMVGAFFGDGFKGLEAEGDEVVEAIREMWRRG